MDLLRRLARSTWMMLAGWILLGVSCFPSLVAKDQTAVFKLDAWVYYGAVAQWQAGGSLYDWFGNPVHHTWPFTYTPFAAWVMTPFTVEPDRWFQVQLTVATPICVAVTAAVVLRALGGTWRTAWGAAPWIALAARITLEPIPKTMEYGQVNAILMAMVAVDLLLVRGRGRGVLCGLAAAVKLTPAIAVLVLVARREWRAAATMTGTALGATALAWLASPTESAQFFLSAMWDPGRAGFADYSGNQNLKGAVARSLPEQLWDPVWLVLSLLTVAGTYLLVRRLGRLDGASQEDGESREDGKSREDGASREAGDRAPGGTDGLTLLVQTCAVMTAGLLVSPISWSHHWVWILPTLLGLAAWALRHDDAAVLGAALLGWAVFALAMQWWFPEQEHVEQDWPVWAAVVGSSYTWWALGTGALLWWSSGRVLSRGRAEAGEWDPVGAVAP